MGREQLETFITQDKLNNHSSAPASPKTKSGGEMGGKPEKPFCRLCHREAIRGYPKISKEFYSADKKGKCKNCGKRIKCQ